MKSTSRRYERMTFAAATTAYVILVGMTFVRMTSASAQPHMPLDCTPAELPQPQSTLCETARRNEGRRLFTEETFGGNGRTCETCHSEDTGTFNPDDVLERLTADPSDPLFVHDGLDDGVSGISRILQHATVRITLPLPDDVTLKNDPAATHITFNRGTPTTLNTPALDDLLMYDLRDVSLQGQALGAIHGHAQNTREPTELELDLIAEFQQTKRFFSNGKLRRFAEGGPAPELPLGTTESEQRGRLFFVDAPFAPPSKVGVCALCHSGPMLNAANIFSTPVFGNPPGARIHNVLVSERNVLGNPTYTFELYDTLDPEPVEVTTPDLGFLMTDHDLLLAEGFIPPDMVLGPVFGIRRGFFASFFKTPTLWGVKDTAPYFHDNSAKNLDEMLEQYDFFFVNSQIAGAIQLTAQDKEDIKAFLQLL